MCTLSPVKPSFQWMTLAGVAPSDVEWLESMDGSKELHAPEAASRVERIYKTALGGVLSSDSPGALLLRALN